MLRNIFSLFHSKDSRAMCCANPDSANAHWGPGINGFIHPVLSLVCVSTSYQWVYHLISFQVLWLAGLAEEQTFPSQSCTVQSLNSLGIGTICVLQGYRSSAIKWNLRWCLTLTGIEIITKQKRKIGRSTWSLMQAVSSVLKQTSMEGLLSDNGLPYWMVSGQMPCQKSFIHVKK